MPNLPRLGKKDQEISASFETMRQAARNAKKATRKDLSRGGEEFASTSLLRKRAARRGSSSMRTLNNGLGSFMANPTVRKCFNLASVAFFTLILVLTCLGISLSLVAFEPINLELAGIVHSERSSEELRAYQNIAVEVLRYVKTLPFETASPIEIAADDLSMLRQWTFFENELCHLTDVRILLGRALLLTYIFGIFSMVVITLTRNKQFARHSLLAAGIACLALPFIGGIFIYFLFDPTFVLFHEVFFPQGNWSFPSETLIISTFPGHYWQMAGLLWMAFFMLGGLILTALSRFCGKIHTWSVTND
jgi:integral membrane protein (TIGR01906 family)